MRRVVVAIISRIVDENKEFLLVTNNKDFGEFTGLYYPPSGHIEGNETDIEGLKRELNEELKMEITKTEFIAETPNDIEGEITAWYRCEVKSFDFEMNKQELVDAKFFTKEQIKNLKLWPATIKFFNKYIF